MAIRHEEGESYDFRQGIWVRPDFLSPRHPLFAGEAPELPPLGRWVEGVPALPSAWSVTRWAHAARWALAMLATSVSGIGFGLWGGFLANRGFVVVGAYGTVASLITLILLAGKADGRKSATEADEALLEDPEDEATCLVEMAVIQDGVVTGIDRGAAWFERGCLLFSGRRTSFVVGTEDLLPKGKREPPPESAWIANVSHLPLRHPKRDVRIRLTPLAHAADPNGKSALKFERTLRHFKERSGKTGLNRQYPPLAPDPQREAPQDLSLGLRLALSSLLLGVLILVEFDQRRRGLPSAVVPLGTDFVVGTGILFSETGLTRKRKTYLSIQEDEPNPPGPVAKSLSPTDGRPR